MYNRLVFCCFIIIVCLTHSHASAQVQTDSLGAISKTLADTTIIQDKKKAATDSAAIKTFSPRTATIRSAILPGWGQAYNKKYWKIPIVYTALGVTAGFFFSNVKTYNELRQAVIYRLDNDPGNDTLISLQLRPLSTQALMQYRSTFRQYIDYSVLVFIFFWGLNVVDATVDAHLKGFNVSPDLTLKIRPDYKLTSGRGNIGLVFQLERRQPVLRLPY